jgi:hypothetical protein
MANLKMGRRTWGGLVVPIVLALGPTIPQVQAAVPPAIQVLAPVKQDVSAPLSSVHPEEDANFNQQQVGQHHNFSHGSGRAPFTASPKSTPTTSTPATTRNFDGVGNGFAGPAGVYSTTGAPPDTNGVAGATQYVQWVNTAFAVFDKTTGAVVYGPAAGNTLWSGFGGACQDDNNGDPIAQYDKAAGRWVMSQFAVEIGPPYFQCFAVSTTSDATGTYNRYAFQFSGFPDYPKIGVWPDAYYAAFNMFQSSTGPFLGPKVCAFNRASMLAGTAAGAQCVALSATYDSLLPSDLDGSTPPPAGAPNYFISKGTNALNTWKFHVDWATPASSTVTGPAVTAVAGFSDACAGGTCIPQKGSSDRLDSLADRLMYRLAYRNFGDHESLVVNHTVVTGSTSGVRWYEVRSPGTTPSIFQWGTHNPADGLWRWLGSAAMDAVGDMALGYSTSSSTIFAGVAYTGRLASDPAGTMGAEVKVITGTGSQNGGLTRWGDYSTMAIDPVDDCTFWYTNEYLKTSGSFNWSTRIASFKFPNCAPAPTQATAAALSPTQVLVNWTPVAGATSYSIERSLDGLTGWSQAGTSAANGFAQTGLQPATYYYRVRSISGNSTSAPSNVASVSMASPLYGGTVTSHGTPVNWVSGQSQSFTVTATNTGTNTWNAAGSNPIQVGGHFMSTSGQWYTNDVFLIPHDVLPGGSVSVAITLVAPTQSGALLLELEMTSTGLVWFSPLDQPVTVSPETWSASYDVSATPTLWSANGTSVYNVTLTNAGNHTWPASGGNAVQLGAHFASLSGQWYDGQQYSLPHDLLPGTSLTMQISVTAWAPPGTMVLEYKMLRTGLYWFGAVQVPVQVL